MEEVIRKQDAIDEINKIIADYEQRAKNCMPVHEDDHGYPIFMRHNHIADGAEKALNAIMKIPAVETKHGYWVNGTHCSICGWATKDKQGNYFMGQKYCPFCGTCMDAESPEEQN